MNMPPIPIREIPSPERGIHAAARLGVGAAVPLAESFVALAKSLATKDESDVYHEVIDAALVHVGGTEHAAISTLGQHGPRLQAASDAIARRAEEVQISCGTGPSVAAADDIVGAVRVDDIRTDRRWDDGTLRLADQGITSILALRLCAREHPIATLTLYASGPRAFTDGSVRAGLLLAIHAGIAAGAAARRRRLRDALHMRDLIGQAKGILTERHKITDDRALELLMSASRRTRCRLHEVAEHTVSDRQLSPASKSAARTPPA